MNDEQFKIRNITGGLKRMSVEVQGGSKAKAMKIEADDHESLLLSGDNEMLDDDDYSECDEKLLDGDNLKLDENTSSSGSSRSFKALEGEGSYSSEEDVATGDLQQTETIHSGTEHDFDNQVSQVGGQESVQQNNVAYAAGQCFALPGVFSNDNEDPAAHMQSLIQPLGTNPFMQQVMKSRLPSTSSVSSDSQVATTAKGTKQNNSAAMASQPSDKIERVMESCFTRPIQSQQQQKQFAEGSPEMSSTVEKIIGFLSTKDQNIFTVPASGGKKSEQQPIKSMTGVNLEVHDQHKNAEEEEEVKRDIESDPFFSGGHISLMFK